MGNSTRPGTVPTEGPDSEPFDIDGVAYVVRSTSWNDIDGLSYDVVRAEDDQIVTEESWDDYPTEAQIAEAVRAFTEAESRAEPAGGEVDGLS